MDKITDNFLMESPVNRNWSQSDDDKNDAHGWVDYWCEYKNYSYYIELKHGFKAYKSKLIRKNVKEEWETAYNQLDSLVDEINLEKEYSKGVFKIMLHVLPIYLHSSSESIKCEIEIEDLIEQQINSMEEISKLYQPNWSALWKLDDNLCKEYSFINGFEKYPAVLILAKVSEIEK